MRRTLQIRTLVRVMLTAAAITGTAVIVYAYTRVLPAGRAVYEQTATLRELYTHLSRTQRAADNSLIQAHQIAQRPDSASLTRLAALLAERDRLVSELPLAHAPPAIRVPLARAVDEAAHMGTVLEAFASNVELGRMAEARLLLAEADSAEVRLLALVDDAQVSGLEGLGSAQGVTNALLREMLLVVVAWLLVAVSLAVVAAVLFERRLSRPLHALREGLRRVERGELNVTLPVGAADEMGEVAEHFNRMTQVLRDRATRQGQVAAAGELLAGAAHEVNNPLMAISATAESRRTDPALTPDTRADLDAIRGEARRAGDLLRAIVSFLRPGVVAPALEDVNELVQDTCNLIWPRLRADGITGTIALEPDLPPVRGVRQKLQQIVVNLLSNAHQATLRGGPTRRIEVRTASREAGRVVAVEVSDTGAGVPGTAVGELFKPFFTTEVDGRVGLGLFTSRMIARDHGGDVTYEPRPGGGSSFVVTLPAAAAPAPAAAAPRAAGGSLQGITVLLVDDDVAVRRPIARFLALRGAQVREAGDGRDALALATEDHVDVVITDLRMPGLDGVGLYRELVARRPELAGRVLFLSGDVAQLAELGGSDVPANRVVTKPIELAELERRILAVRQA